jgi:nucleotide-binding universal stress UspA family protein
MTRHDRPVVTSSEAPRIVVGVDGSPSSRQALAWAAEEARLRGARLEVVYCTFYRPELLQSYEGVAAGEQEILDRAVASARAMEPTVDVVGHRDGPPPAKALVEASEGAALLVVGVRGLGGFQQLLLGSVSQQCAHHARCPVAVVRGEGTGRLDRPGLR